MADSDDAVVFDGVLAGRDAGDAGRIPTGVRTKKMEKMTHTLNLGTPSACTHKDAIARGNGFCSCGALIKSLASPSMNELLNPKGLPWTREQYLREFQALTAKMLEITTKKNNDYGGHTDPFKNFRDFEELGILVRMSDKFARLRTALAEKREFQVSDETVEDTALDLANYALLLICYRRGA